MPSSVETFGMLLDRSIAQIADASADVRVIDVPTIVGISDIWDNNTGPLFEAVGRWPRERRARAALRWMGDLGADRRAWMVAQEPSLDAVLAPARAEVAYRDYRGEVWPLRVPSLDDSRADLRSDYDLAAGVVTWIRASQRAVGLRVSVSVVAPARHGGSATLTFRLAGVQRLAFDAGDVIGITLAPGAATIGWGTAGSISATDCDVEVDDDSWHLSRAGRRADAVTPHDRETRVRPPRGHPPGQAALGAAVIHAVMLGIRSVRYERKVPSVPVNAMAEALRGAGRAVVAAGALRGRRRDAAFGDLVAAWVARLPPSEEVHRRLRFYPDLSSLLRPVPPRCPVPLDGPVTLRFAAYRAGHDNRPAEATAQVAADDGGGWRLAGRVVPEPAGFRLDERAFEGPQPLARSAHTIRLGEDSLVIDGPPDSPL